MSREVVHMVWFKAPSITKEQFEATYEAGKKLAEIPGVISVDFGENFTNRSNGFNLGLLVRLKDKESLEVYDKHPIHQEFKEKISFREDVMALDFEV